MNEATIPDDLVSWEEVDVFIFSNGQQYSPPRKYHLDSDELNTWHATLAYLAHSQYGSGHSRIELFTLEGKKVETSLQLVNEMAYVAVIPPDAFINAGYEKYLLKASRSWEKRQGKLVASQEAAVSSVDENIKNDNLKTVVEKGICRKKNDSLAKSKVQQRNINPTDSINNSIEKKKGYSGKKKVLKNVTTNPLKNPSVSQTSIKTSSKSPKTSISKKTEQQNLISKNIKSANVLPSLEIDNKEQSQLKQNENFTETEVKTIILSGEHVANSVQNKTTEENKVYSNGYKNPYSESVSLFVDAEKDLISAISKNYENISKIIYEEPKSENIKFDNVDNEPAKNEVHKDPGRVSLHYINNTKSQTNIPNIKPYETRHVINLNLNIKLKDCRGDENLSNEKYKLECEKQSQTDVLNIDNMLNMNSQSEQDGCCSGCLPNHTAYKCPFGDGEHNKVIIIRCSCSNNSTEKNKEVSDCHKLELPYSVKQIGFNNSVPIQNDVSTLERLGTEKIKSEVKGKETTCENNVKVDCSCKTHETISKFSQTEWCDTLVEAKQNQDGHYMFQLPSLQKLKEFNL